MVDLGACRQVSITRESVEGTKASSKIGRLALQLVTNWFGRDPNRKQFEFYDPLALATALDPSIITTRQTEVAVEFVDPSRWGESRAVSHRGPVALAEDVDVGRFFRLLEDLFQWSRR